MDWKVYNGTDPAIIVPKSSPGCLSIVFGKRDGDNWQSIGILIGDGEKMFMSSDTQARSQAEARAESAVAEAKTRADSVAAAAGARAEKLIATTVRNLEYLRGQMPTMSTVPMHPNWEPIGTAHINNVISPSVDPDQLRKAVLVRAYYKAEQRAFWPGHEVDDWLEAEQEILCVSPGFERGLEP